MIEAELAFELAVVEFDHPSQPASWASRCGLVRAGRLEIDESVAPRRLGPLDDQPLFAGRDAVAGDRVRGGDVPERER